MAESADSYIGNELETFRHSVNWKRYFSSRIRPHLGDTVLEVGAGIGGTAPFLCNDKIKHWTFLEPDESFCRQIESQLNGQGFQADYEIINGTLDALAAEAQYDTVLYMDVLEHIERDREELANAMARLNRGGRIVVLCPAHQFLYSEFDKAIGHYRRYSLKGLVDLCPEGMSVSCRKYLDSLGMFASLANSLLLKQKAPSLRQVLFWDKIIVPVSIWLDALLFYRVGKSVLVVYTKD